MLYKIRAYNEHRAFFLREDYKDIIYHEKRQAINFKLCLAGVYDRCYDLTLEVTDEHGNKVEI